LRADVSTSERINKNTLDGIRKAFRTQVDYLVRSTKREKITYGSHAFISAKSKLTNTDAKGVFLRVVVKPVLDEYHAENPYPAPSWEPGNLDAPKYLKE